MRSVGVATLIVAAAAPRPADACTCGPVDWLVPGPEAVGVPPNIAMLVMDRLDEMRLRNEATGQEITLAPRAQVGPGSRLQLFSPLEALAPSASYTLTFSIGNDMRGEYLLYLRTAAAPDLVPPPMPDVEAMTFWRLDPNQDECGKPLRVDGGTLSNIGEAATIGVRVTRDGFNDVRYLRPHAGALDELGPGFCGTSVEVEAGGPYEVAVWAHDLAGNKSAERVVMVEVMGDGAPDDGGGDPVPIEPGDGGCSSGRSSSMWMGLLVLGLLRRRH